MKAKHSSKSGLFLMELIIAIVFFAVASAICVQLFVNAYMTSAQSRRLSSANAILQTEAENFKRNAPQLMGGGDSAESYYSEAGVKMEQDGAAYRVIGRFQNEDGLCTATYTVYLPEGDEEIASLTVKTYDETLAG